MARLSGSLSKSSRSSSSSLSKRSKNSDSDLLSNGLTIVLIGIVLYLLYSIMQSKTKDKDENKENYQKCCL